MIERNDQPSAEKCRRTIGTTRRVIRGKHQTGKGFRSKLSRNLYSASSVSPPTNALNMEVPAKCSLGKSAQMLASLPTNRAAANLSCSSLCRLFVAILHRPRKRTNNAR